MNPDVRQPLDHLLVRPCRPRCGLARAGEVARWRFMAQSLTTPDFDRYAISSLCKPELRGVASVEWQPRVLGEVNFATRSSRPGPDRRRRRRNHGRPGGFSGRAAAAWPRWGQCRIELVGPGYFRSQRSGQPGLVPAGAVAERPCRRCVAHDLAAGASRKVSTTGSLRPRPASSRRRRRSRVLADIEEPRPPSRRACRTLDTAVDAEGWTVGDAAADVEACAPVRLCEWRWRANSWVPLRPRARPRAPSRIESPRTSGHAWPATRSVSFSLRSYTGTMGSAGHARSSARHRRGWKNTRLGADVE